MDDSQIEELVNLLEEYMTEFVDDENQYIEFSQVKSEIETHIS